MLTTLALLLPAVLLAQTPTTNTDAVVQALVTEIRELRLTLERSQLLTLRFQAAALFCRSKGLLELLQPS